MCPFILLITVLMQPPVNLLLRSCRESTRKPLSCSEQATTTKGQDKRSFQKSYGPPVGTVNFLPSWSETGLLPGVPSRGTGTVLPCGSPLAPGPSRRLLPCCCEAAGTGQTGPVRPCLAERLFPTHHSTPTWFWLLNADAMRPPLHTPTSK